MLLLKEVFCWQLYILALHPQGNSYTINLQYHATHPVSFHLFKYILM